jgi:ribosomal protein S18 acetylase RimI-like enzyme
MLTDAIRQLILDEQARQSGRFIEGVDLDAYLRKLDEQAEIHADVRDGRCRGFVAFYCNNQQTRQAFITSVVVAPPDRGTGLGRELVRAVLDTCRSRGFTRCRLEVRSDNVAAIAMYTGLGFVDAGARDGRQVLEVAL